MFLEIKDIHKSFGENENRVEVLKGIGIWLSKGQKVYAKQNLKIISRNLKNVNMVAFVGEFSTNIKFPDYFSIGKRKSLGYGSFIRIM